MKEVSLAEAVKSDSGVVCEVRMSSRDVCVLSLLTLAGMLFSAFITAAVEQSFPGYVPLVGSLALMLFYATCELISRFIESKPSFWMFCIIVSSVCLVSGFFWINVH